MLKINWPMLAKQKETLLQVISTTNPTDASTLDGLVNLLDAMQDDAVISGVATEFEVFGEALNV